MLPPTILLAVISYHVMTNALRPGYINTFAGTGLASYGGDGSAATSAWLNGPKGVAVDASNNLYIADTGNNKIRFVYLTTGIVTTYAGIGTAGYDGDYGPAAKAQLNSPYGMVIDTSNNVYIADYGNNKIRLVTASSRNISTYAGTGKAAFGGDGYPATMASLNGPSNVAFDISGNLWIVDFNNARVRLVTKSTGYITSYYYARTNSYGDLIYPHGVASDASGNNLIIWDSFTYIWGHNTAVSIITQGGAETTYAGGGSSTDELTPATSFHFALGVGISLDTFQNLYIADQERQTLCIMTKSTGLVQTLAGNGKQGFSGDNGLAILSQLNNPSGIAIDTSGNVFIADTGNNRIRMVQTTLTPTPTSAPTSARPTQAPSLMPTPRPTMEPSVEPTHPTYAPSVAPSQPTPIPTVAPTQPSPAPTAVPSLEPTSSPSSHQSAGKSTGNSTTAGNANTASNTAACDFASCAVPILAAVLSAVAAAAFAACCTDIGKAFQKMLLRNCCPFCYDPERVAAEGNKVADP